MADVAEKHVPEHISESDRASHKAMRHNILLLVVIEMALALIWVDMMAGLYWYPEIDWKNYLALPHMASNVKAVMYTVAWLAIEIGVFRLMWFDTPVTKNAKDAYDQTHDMDGKLRPWLKVVDDVIVAYSNKGRGVSATNIYDDISKAVDDGQQPAQQQAKPVQQGPVATPSPNTGVGETPVNPRAN
jgi:hypothetical protein